MHFSYRGFRQLNGSRQFTFLGLVDKQPEVIFLFNVDLTLLALHSVSIQETPSLCVQLLTRALAETPEAMIGFSNYSLTIPDLEAFTAPRRALAYARSTKRVSRVVRPKPAEASQPFSQALSASAR